MKAKTKFKIVRWVKKILNYYDQPPYIQIETQRIIRLRSAQIFSKVELDDTRKDIIIRDMCSLLMEKILNEKCLDIKTDEFGPTNIRIEMELDIVVPRR